MSRILDLETAIPSDEDAGDEPNSIKVWIEGKANADDCRLQVTTLYGETSMSLGDFERIASEVAKYRALKAQADTEAA